MKYNFTVIEFARNVTLNAYMLIFFHLLKKDHEHVWPWLNREATRHQQ